VISSSVSSSSPMVRSEWLYKSVGKMSQSG
jgi:hypothetical protein